MNLKTKSLTWLALVAAATLATACTNKQGETEAPVYITVDLTDQAGLTNIVPARTLTIPTMTLNSHLKNPAAPDTAGFATTEVSYYTVTYRRADGGTLVPPVQQFAVGQSMTATGSLTLTEFPVLTQSAMEGTPFDQLLNGGIDRETGNTEIRMYYDVVFYGSTVSGFRVQSETATGIRVFVAQ